jgi:hypothetical protein
VKNVKEETITQQKIKKLILKSLKLKNIVNGVINTLFIKKQNFKKAKSLKPKAKSFWLFKV